MKKLRETFADLMLEIGSKDKTLVVLVGDISHEILKPFAKKFPDRYYNIGICEPSIVNIAAGLKKVGLNPVVHTIAPFISERSYEQIKLDFGYQRLGINFVTIGSTFDYSKLGCTHHCYSDVSLLSHFENSNIFIPGSNIEFDNLFRKAYKKNSINYFRLTDNSHGVKIDKKILIGKAIKVTNGNDITLAVIGSQLKNAQMAYLILKKKNISCEIIYFPTIKPFDNQTFIKSVKKTKKFISIEELSASDGLYNLCLKAIKGNFLYKSDQIAIKKFVHEYGTYNHLCKITGLNFENIVNRVKKLLR